jgi:hypothetical protein
VLSDGASIVIALHILKGNSNQTTRGNGVFRSFYLNLSTGRSAEIVMRNFNSLARLPTLNSFVDLAEGLGVVTLRT